MSGDATGRPMRPKTARHAVPKCANGCGENPGQCSPCQAFFAFQAAVGPERDAVRAGATALDFIAQAHRSLTRGNADEARLILARVLRFAEMRDELGGVHAPYFPRNWR